MGNQAIEVKKQAVIMKCKVLAILMMAITAIMMPTTAFAAERTPMELYFNSKLAMEADVPYYISFRVEYDEYVDIKGALASDATGTLRCTLRNYDTNEVYYDAIFESHDFSYKDKVLIPKGAYVVKWTASTTESYRAQLFLDGYGY